MTIETFTPTEEQRRMVIRNACCLVTNMQHDMSPGEALAMLSIAVQLVILNSMPTRAEAISAIDQLSGEARSAIMTNLGTHSEAGHG